MAAILSRPHCVKNGNKSRQGLQYTPSATSVNRNPHRINDKAELS